MFKEFNAAGMLWSSFFVTLVAKKIVLINLCCRPCFIWGSITIITVWTNMIIINVCKFFYLLIECFLCCKLIQICAFILQGIDIGPLGESDAGKSYLAKAIGIKACNRYNVVYFHREELLKIKVALKEQDYDKYARKMKKYLKWELIILDDFLLHTITDEREIKILFELLEKRNEQRKTLSYAHSVIRITGKQ